VTTQEEADGLRARLDEAGQRNPRDFPFGAFIGDTYPLSTVFVFVWFESATGLLDTLAECEPILHLEFGTEEYETMLSTLGAIRESARPHDRLTEDLRVEFGAALSKMEAGLRWWGALDELVSGDGEFPRELREAFREYLEDEANPDRAISPNDIDEFVEFIVEYGI